MPYITCPDGNTYSRYDQDPYVQDCICQEKEAQQKEYNECMADPHCKANRESTQAMAIWIGGIVFILIVFTLIKGIRKL